MSSLNHFLNSIPPYAVLLLIFLLPFLESSFFLGFVLPGETTVIIGSSIASYKGINFIFCLIAAVCGAILGDYIGYLFGKFFGNHIIDKHCNRYKKVKMIVDAGKVYINKYGAIAVFLGRFTAVMRAMVPFICGNTKMKKSIFVKWNILGGITWGAIFTTLGYFFADVTDKVLKIGGFFGLVIFIFFLILIIFLIKKNRKRWQKNKNSKKT